MFDSSDFTYWESGGKATIEIHFFTSIKFEKLTILKKRDDLYKEKTRDNYLNVCLVLDENTNDQLCTTKVNGFDGDTHSITWEKPKDSVHKVQLIFKDNKNAQIADLKVHYFIESCSKGNISILLINR